MKYDPERHHRRSIRLKGFDYSQANLFYVTVCVHHRLCLLSEVHGDEVRLSPAGEMVLQVWEQMPTHYPGVEVDAFVVMPNHVHGIVALDEFVEPENQEQAPVPAPTEGGLSLPDVIHRFKTLTTTRYIYGVKHLSWPGFDQRFWQRNYYEHVIRDENDLNRIRKYIFNNPITWSTDKENL